MPVDDQLSAAFDNAGINQILLVDDAYDAPSVELIADALEDFLEDPDSVHTCEEVGIAPAAISSSQEALDVAQYDHPDLLDVVQRLFDAFAKEYGSKYDPDGAFSKFKEPSLRQLQTLVELLQQSATNIEVNTTGRGDAESRWHDTEPQMVLLDYELDDSLPGSPTESDRSSASVDFLKTILNSQDELPSIVLMTDKKLPPADQYRKRAGERLLAVRLSLLNKRTAVDASETTFSTAARDALLDACQGFRFGNLLDQALSEWSDAVDRAQKRLATSIRDLDAKDFAYLIRFRLRADATGLADYIDWLFGEHLRGLTEDEICWTDGSFADLDGADRLEDMIEGAQDGPTSAIANVFHSVRVGGRRNRGDRDYRLGDLYARKGGNEVRVVVTPDCDLIGGAPEDGQVTRRAKVANLLTMGGSLHHIGAQEAVADELLLRNNRPSYVGWRPKDLLTFPLRGEGALHEDPQYQYIGTLKPLYALRTQHRALGDLSRIGLPIAPALGVNMPVSVWLKPDNQNVSAFKLELDVGGTATIVPKREGQRGGHHVLLPRHFVHAVMDTLTAAPLDKRTKRIIAELVANRAKLDQLLLVNGAEVGGQPRLGVAFHLDRPNNKKGAAGLQFVLNASAQVKDSLDAI